MRLACSRLFLDIHIVAQRVGVLLAAVGQCPLLVLDLLVPDVGMVGLPIDISDVQMVSSDEVQSLGIPSAHVEVESTVLVTFLAYTGFEQLIGGRGSRPVLEVLEHTLLCDWTL